MSAIKVKQDGVWLHAYPPYAVTEAPLMSGGVVDEVYLDGVLHVRHTFSANGTLTVLKGGVFTMFMVGGGAPGGNGNGTGYEAGGGGAGRVRWNRYSRNPGDYSVTVGAGGAAGANGSASVFDGIQCQGGRRGAHGGAAAPSGVGSNGGGAHNRTAGGVTTTPSDGITFANDGETPSAASSGGGGGGAMQMGGTNGVGRGGDGIEFPPGSGQFYAGGGGAFAGGANRAGGLGGGGNAPGGAGTNGRGAGGGGAYNGATGVGGRGGDGVVQILYQKSDAFLITATPSSGQVTVEWAPVPAAVAYQLEMDGDTRTVYPASPAVVTGLVDGVPHTFKVRAVLADGKVTAWSNTVTAAAA